MASIPRFPADASAHDVAGALTTAGAAIIERLVPGSLVDELLGQMHPLIEATPFGGDDFVGRRTKRTGALLRVTGDGSGPMWLVRPVRLVGRRPRRLVAPTACGRTSGGSGRQKFYLTVRHSWG
jgi:hypothetical protein